MDFIKPSLLSLKFVDEAQIRGKQLREFVFAGNAIFTVMNTDTKNRFTLKVKKHKENDIFFVSVMTGSDNYTSYTFIGTYFPNKGYKKSYKSKIGSDAMSAKMVQWFFNSFINNQKKYETIKVYHEDKCGRCGRKLTTPESVKSGFGPECIKLVGNKKGE
jgi:hypothetical protein